MIESASKANARYDTIASGARYVGVAGVLVQAGLSAYDIASAPPSQRARIAGQDIGGLGGALAGAEAGSEGGAAIGSLAGPLGTLVDGVVGGLGGAVVGGIAGSSVARWIGGFL